MKSKLQKIGIDTYKLDDIVTQAALAAAEYANREGMDAQLQFLKINGYDEDRIWGLVVSEHLAVGMSVDVSEPLSPDSPHNHAFQGTVKSTDFDDYVVVEDQDGACWGISFNEIESFRV